MRGGFIYLNKSRKQLTKRGKGVKSKRHKLRKSHKRTRSRKSRKSKKFRKSMRGGSIQSLTPADFQADNTVIASNQPHVGPNLNIYSGYGFKFSDPEIGGSFQPNSQCEQYVK